MSWAQPAFDARGTHVHLDRHVPLFLCNLLPNRLDGFFHPLDCQRLVRARGGHDVQRGSDQSDLDGNLLGRERLAGLESPTDSLDTGVVKASDLDVGPDLDGLGSESAGDDGAEVGEGFRVKVEGAEDGVGFAGKSAGSPNEVK